MENYGAATGLLNGLQQGLMAYQESADKEKAAYRASEEKEKDRQERINMQAAALQAQKDFHSQQMDANLLKAGYRKVPGQAPVDQAPSSQQGLLGQSAQPSGLLSAPGTIPGTGAQAPLTADNNPDSGLQQAVGLMKAQAPTQGLMRDQPNAKQPGLIQSSPQAQYILDENSPAVKKRQMDLDRESLSMEKLKAETEDIKRRAKEGTATGNFAKTREANMIIRGGSSFDNDPRMKTIGNVKASIDRARSLLEGEAPLTAQSFMMAQQDLANALAQGGTATEGKVKRDVIDPYANKLNEIQGRFGVVADLRKTAPDIVNQIRKVMKQVDNDYTAEGLSKLDEIRANFDSIDNQKLQDTIDRKYKLISDRLKNGYKKPAAAENIQERTLHNGQKVKVRQMPDGTYQQVQ